MAMADNRKRYMPLPDDRLPGRGKPLATPEAVLLVNPVEPEFKGEVPFFAHIFSMTLSPCVVRIIVRKLIETNLS